MGWIILIIVVVVILFVISIYNNLVGLKQKVKNGVAFKETVKRKFHI